MKTSNDYFLTHRDFMEYVADSNNGDDIPMMYFSSKQCEVFSKKITITYEVDREVTIKESDIDRLLGDRRVGFTDSDIRLIKEKLFGDSNETDK